MNKQLCSVELHAIGALQFGDFTLSSGIKSPYYIDLRRIISSPRLLEMITELFWQKINTCSFDYITGVPYAALPLATALAVRYKIPMIMPRKEAKTHGTRQQIEGVYEQGKTCLLIEDLFTSGKSSLETVAILEQAGLIVTDIAAVLDREQGGKEYIEEKGYHAYTLFTVTELARILVDHKLITQEQSHAVTAHTRL